MASYSRGRTRIYKRGRGRGPAAVHVDTHIFACIHFRELVNTCRQFHAVLYSRFLYNSLLSLCGINYKTVTVKYRNAMQLRDAFSPFNYENLGSPKRGWVRAAPLHRPIIWNCNTRVSYTKRPICNQNMTVRHCRADIAVNGCI